MSTSAKAVYFAIEEDGNFTYVFLLHNTSPEPYHIYAGMIDAGYVEEPETAPSSIFGNCELIALPAGWFGDTGSGAGGATVYRAPGQPE